MKRKISKFLSLLLAAILLLSLIAPAALAAERSDTVYLRTAEDLAELAIAGGFGSYLSLDSAAAIGLIPPTLKPRCRVLGNAALAGASMLLRSRPLLEESAVLAKSAVTADLATDPIFMEQYVEQMMF